MRTIRTKVYQFSELSEQAKERAIKDRFRHVVVGTKEQRESVIKWLEKCKHEFKADGTRF